jgi:hypothetical protein
VLPEIHLTEGDGRACEHIPWFPGLSLPDLGDEINYGWPESKFVVHRNFSYDVENERWIVHIVLGDQMDDEDDEDEEPGKVGW